MDGKRSSVQVPHCDAQAVSVQLEEQNHTFALDKSRPVTGKLHMHEETVIFTGENLKGREKSYKLFFIGRKDGGSVYKIIGDVIPDMHGNAELKCKINPADIDGEGTALSCFYIFLVAAMGKPLQPVLKGDLTVQQNMERRENRNARRASASRTYNNYYSEYIREKISALMTVSDKTYNISPFDDVWLTDNWKRASDVSEFPVASVGAEKQIQKYGHFIFGYREERFYLGVPGRHTEEEWPDRGKSGFLLWQSIRGSEEYGYWMMVIERKTGIITEFP